MLKEKKFYKGVNLGGWLSQCDYSEDRINNFITESDIKKVSSWGADHVRVPFDYNILENADGSYKEEGFRKLESTVKTCIKYNLNVLLDLHKTAGFSFDNYNESESGFFESEEYQERFYRLWEKVAQTFSRYSDNVAFELLNEITHSSYIDTWNRVADRCIRRIRKYAPDTLIFVGSYHHNSALTVQYLNKPYDDKVIYNMHCYEPLKFTHQGAYWADIIKKDERFSFEEMNCTPEYFEELFSSAVEKAQKNNTFLYCGEYGVIDIVPADDMIKWLKCINSVFEKYGIGRAIWTYKEMDFGLADKRLENHIDTIVKYI